MQVVTQLPALQVAPVACGSLVVQACPHEPQLAPSVCSLTQVLPQSVLGGEHVGMHAPPLQVVLPVHTVPQAPQWLLSVSSSTHVPPHRL